MALQDTLNSLGKQFGHDVAKRGVKPEPTMSVPTGSIALDTATGIGGFPRGRVVEVFGPESSGKTTLVLHAIAEAQKRGLTAAFIDAEHALDTNYAATLGVDLKKLVLCRPQNGEEALEIVHRFLMDNVVHFIVVDSVAALVPRVDVEGCIGDAHEYLKDRLMDQALGKIVPVCGATGATVIFTNQIRPKHGVVFGNPEMTVASDALKYYASMRLDIRKVGQIKKIEERCTGSKVRVKVVKSKVSVPFGEAEFEIHYGVGIRDIPPGQKEA